MKFSYKNNSNVSKPKHQYKKAKYQEDESEYRKFIKNLNNNGIGVNKIIESAEFLGLELTQFAHTNLDTVEEIIRRASFDSGIETEIKKDLRIANLQAFSEYDIDSVNSAKVVYERKTKPKFTSNTNLSFRPFIASENNFLRVQY